MFVHTSSHVSYENGASITQKNSKGSVHLETKEKSFRDPAKQLYTKNATALKK